MGVRAALLVLALVGLVAAWAAGRRLAGPAAGLAAAAVLAVAPPYPTLAATVESDPPATVLALCAIALLLYARDRRWVAFSAGAVFALALSVKLFAIAAALSLLALALRRRRVADVLWPAAGFAAVILGFVVAYRHVLHEVWQGVFGAHLNARGGHQPVGESNLSRVIHLPDLHTPFGWLAVAALVLAVVEAARTRTVPLWPLWLFTLGAVLFTLTMKPLLDHHLVLLATALAVPVGATLGRLPRPALVVLALFVCAGLYQERHRLARNDVPERPSYRWAAQQLERRTAPGDLVVSDIPSIPYLAHRREPGQLIDASHARAVVVGRNFLTKPAIVRGIAKRYPVKLRNGEVTIYLPAR